MLGLDHADALETAGLDRVGPPHRPAAALSLLPGLLMPGVVLRLEQWDVPVGAAWPVEPDATAAFADIPLPRRTAWTGDVVAAAAQALPMRSRP